MSTRRFLTLTVLVGLLGAAPAQAPTDSPSPPHLNCTSGPLTRTFGKTSWYVYGCDDGHSVVVITAPGNPAMPFYFFFVWGPKGFELHGEGTGDKTLTDAAFEDLKALTDSDVARLYKDCASVGRRT